MGMAVVTVGSGGLPVIDVTPIATMTPRKYGTPVTEATNGRGIRVTKVSGANARGIAGDLRGAAAAARGS